MITVTSDALAIRAGFSTELARPKRCDRGIGVRTSLY